MAASSAHSQLLRSRAASRIAVAFRRSQSRRAAASARRLLVDESLLLRLAAVWARTESRAATLVQWHWRHVRRSREFHSRMAMQRINHAMLRHRANTVAKELERQRQQEQAEFAAAVRLQAALRRCVARKHRARAEHTRAVGLLHAHFGANRQLRAAGRVQRAWVSQLAKKREREAEAQAASAEWLALRLARARSSELRTRHYAVIIARRFRQFVQQRLQAAASLRGWLVKRVQPHSSTAPGHRWRTRYFWVAGGALRYDSVKYRVARMHGWPIRELRAAVPLGPGTIRLLFGRGSVARHSMVLRSREPGLAEHWRCQLLWLAHLVDANAPSAALRPWPDSATGAFMTGAANAAAAKRTRLPPSAQHPSAQHASHYRGDVSGRGALVDALRSLEPGAPLQAEDRSQGNSGSRSRGGTAQGELAAAAVERRLAEAAMRRADAAAFETREDRRTKARLAT